MHTIQSRVHHIAWRVKKGFAQWNPWARNVSQAAESHHNTETARVSHPPPSMPDRPFASKPTSTSPPSYVTSFQNICQMLFTPLPSTNNLIDPRQLSNHVDYEQASFPSATATLESQNTCNHDPNEVLVEPSHILVGNPSDVGHQRSHPTSNEGSLCDDIVIAKQQRQSDHSFPVPQDNTVDDLTRLINIVIPGNDESTHCAGMLVDSGDKHVNLISRKVVNRLGLTPSNQRPSYLKRVLNILAPWTESARIARKQVNNRVRGYDGKEISGQDGIVTLCWYGKNRTELHDPIIWFRPVRYETTHVVVDADCCSEVVLSWKEVQRLKLRERFAIPVRKAPATDPNADQKYAEYEKARAEKAAARQVARDQKQENGQGQPSDASSTKPDRTGN